MIVIKDLSFAYPRQPLLFQGLNLSLGEGHIYGLLGKNGAGKSTLLKNMVGLAYPRQGSCLINGVNVSGRPVSVLEDVYFLAEQVFAPSLTPEQFAASTAVFYPKFSNADFYQCLKVRGLDAAGAMYKQS